MISNEERRAAAARLRQFLSMSQSEHACGYDGLQTVGSLVGTSVGESILARLADLIDRPTCRKLIPDEMEGLVFCSNCGAEIGEYGVPNYCHNCGAEVQE